MFAGTSQVNCGELWWISHVSFRAQSNCNEARTYLSTKLSWSNEEVKAAALDVTGEKAKKGTFEEQPESSDP